MISVVITSYNEAEKLNKCLESIKNFADEIIVLDLGSTDNTESICKKFNAKIFKHKLVPFVEFVRNVAISKASGDWILVLDPDEIIQKELKDKLKDITKQKGYIAVNIPRKNIFFGRWIKHTNWWPDYHVRFFKKGKVEWTNKIHIYPEVDGEILKLPADEDIAILHYGYGSIKQFIDRQNRYSEIEAEQRFKEGVRFSWINFFWWPTREFLVRFIKHMGFMDGFYGFALTFLMMVYKLEILIKLWEKEEKR